ncbi:L-proline trans-4-hydroxylase-like [Lineus longissimus]|uniref:L-proline trans-4-hydroxylase-like n=1 Tax=Lineus longissimus TaxID=88925 RepID=UPI002B4EED5B
MTNIKKFSANEDGFKVTREVQEYFDENGYIVVKGLLDSEEVTMLKEAMEQDRDVLSNCFERDDGDGQKVKLSLWNEPGDDITGYLARSDKVAGTFDELLGGEVYHFHTKLVQKEAFTGGSFVWHQDYGYWYDNGVLVPDLGTVSIAIDRADTSNGCLKVLPRSHKAGRIHHVVVAEQVGADPDRMKYLTERFDVVDVELDPGDALFFHCNLLHKSDQNNSPNRRWAMLFAYNRANNSPVIVDYHQPYKPLKRVRNSEVKNCSKSTQKRNYLDAINDDQAYQKQLQEQK